MLVLFLHRLVLDVVFCHGTCYNRDMKNAGSEPSYGTPSVVLAHPHALIRDGIARIVKEADFQVVGQIDTTEGLKRLLAQYSPDIALVDWELPGINADTTRELTESNPGVTIVILTLPEPSDSIVAGIQAGAKGYLSVNLSPQEFVQALRMLMGGVVIVSDEVTGSLKDELISVESSKPTDDLSDRELEVLGLVGNGATNREIAQRLIVSEHTVKVHLRSILNKLNLRNRQQAAAYAGRQGLVENGYLG